MKSKILFSIVVVLLFLPLATAKTGHMKLLTVGGTGNNTQGGVADLYLEIKPGSGTIFIDSFPLTKLDTQISTRFANEIACDFLDKDCTQYDFFYTIRAKASIVGGPSAGAAIATLTASMLSGEEIDENTVITGTINSGGLVGPVAGIDEKIQAAARNGYTNILVPKWQSEVNVSKIQSWGLEEKITVVKVKNLQEAMYHFTSKSYSATTGNISVSHEYSSRMQDVAEMLCHRSSNISELVKDVNHTLLETSENFLNRSKSAEKIGDHYARASYCFSANIRLRELAMKNLTDEELKKIYSEVNSSLKEVKSATESKSFETLSDLQTYMIVQERISEAENYIEVLNYTNISSNLLAYAKERLFSAVAWSEFFGMKGKIIDLNEDHLQNACLEKMSEAEERINYVELYLPGILGDIKSEVDSASKYFNTRDYPLCIFKASKAKSEANILLTVLSIKEENLETVVEEKLEAARRVIVEQEQEDIFPILGYSYYEYSQSLLGHDPGSSLRFTEYALELSKLDMYFPKKNGFDLNFNTELLKIFLFGFVVGAAVTGLIVLKRKK